MFAFLLLLLRLLLGSLWIAAGIAKLRAGSQTEKAVADFGLIPGVFARVLGRLLPWGELTLGLFLLLGKWTTFAAGFSLILLLLFSLAIGINLRRGRLIACHCFGQSSQKPISWRDLVRNGLLMFATMALLFRAEQSWSWDAWAAGDTRAFFAASLIEAFPLLLVLVAGLLIWTLAASFWELAQNLARASEGPARELPERPLLRRWFRLEPEE